MDPIQDSGVHTAVRVLKTTSLPAAIHLSPPGSFRTLEIVNTPRLTPF